MNKTFVALAVAFFATTANAAFFNSKHDFINNGYVTPAPTTTGCGYCHVPHNANTTAGAPIWHPSRTLTNASAFYTGLRGGTITITDVDTKGTKTCLGCHATGSTTDMGTTVSMTTQGATAAIIGTALNNDHPIGNEVALANGGFGMQATITLGGLTIGAGSTMQCSTCHEVHNGTGVAQAGTKLLRAYTGDFCLACHNK